jgi:hypothetical protein
MIPAHIQQGQEQLQAASAAQQAVMHLHLPAIWQVNLRYW